MKKKIRWLFVGIGFFIPYVLFSLISTAQLANATTDKETHPTFGLYCAEEGKILSGNEKFDLTNSELFSEQKAIKESEYRATGNQTTTFEIPFFSAYADTPQFNVTVNGQSVKGDIWYGDNVIRYGGDNSYLQVDNMDNSVFKQKLKRIFSPVLDDMVVGTLYSVTPNSDTMTATMKLAYNSSYVYDNTNLSSQSYGSDGNVFSYADALSHKPYQYFFVGENSIVDFTTDGEYKTEQISFKEFIDRNYEQNKEHCEQIGATKECMYSIANMLLQDTGRLSYTELFNDAFNIARTALNAYKFSVPLNGEVIVKYSSIVNVRVITRYEPTIYAIGQKQIGNYTTTYTMGLGSDVPYIVQSSNPTKKSGKIYTASATENFYFMCSSSKKPIDPNIPPRFSKAQLIVLIVGSIVIGICLIILIVNLILWLRKRYR